MFRPITNKFIPFITKRFMASCDDFEEPSRPTESASFVSGIRTPMQYENLRNVLGGASVNSYDGMRMIVQKQVNLNTVVSHFFWIGSQSAPPVYQYRLILPFDDKVVNVSTDPDFNIEGEVKYPVNKNFGLKFNATYNDQQNVKNASVDVEIQDDSSATQLQLTTDKTVSLSYMQSVTPNITLGGSTQYSMKSKALETSYGGVANFGDNSLAFQYDNNFHLLYTRKVNPNRVHLMSDLVVDAKGQTQMTLSAEYMLKQAKLHMSVDSNLLIKSSLESSVSPGMQLQFAAETMQAQNHYKFGCGIVMG